MTVTAADLSQGQPNLEVGEVIAAVVGLRKLLSGTRPLTLDQQRRAETFPDLLARTTRRVLAQDAEEPSTPEKFDFDAINGLLSKAGARQSGRIMAVYPPDIARPTALVVGRILDLLHAALPRTVTMGLVGGEVSRGTPGATQAFRALWHVAENPLSVLQDLAAGHLTPEAVTALETLYPNLYATITAAAQAGLKDIKATRPRWRPTPRKERQIRTLLQQDVPGGLGAVMSAVYADERAKEKVTPEASRPFPAGAGGIASPGQSLG